MSRKVITFTVKELKDKGVWEALLSMRKKYADEMRALPDDAKIKVRYKDGLDCDFKESEKNEFDIGELK